MPNSLNRRAFVAIATSTAIAGWLPEDVRSQRTLPGELRLPSLDRDLLEVTIGGLQTMYAEKKYTVVQVTRWYLERITRYNPVYRALLHIDSAGALATAAAQDAAAARGGPGFTRGPLWGVPVVIKANTSVKGMVTSAGWSGFLIPGLELVAPIDAPIVARLRAAGAVIIGQTNMPDFAASDSNISSAYGRTGNAYDWKFSPGGSSGGTVTSIAANLALVGTGTDTANSIRMPAATSAVVGVLPTRGLTPIAGICPLDWLRDNTGPIARTVTDAAIMLDVMAGEDAKDFRTQGSAALAQPGPYTRYLKTDALRGKRLGVPAFIVSEATGGLDPSTRDIFIKSLDGLRAAGATVVIDNTLLPDSFALLASSVNTRPYTAEGTESFLRDFGPAAYHSPAEYARAVGALLPATLMPTPIATRPPVQRDPEAERLIWEPQRKALAAYDEAFARFRLDGLAYPAIQQPPFDEVEMASQGRRSAGPHSNTDWVNRIGVPAISIPGGFYANGLPFGLELAAKRWKDGDLLGYAYAYEQATHHRKPPVLQDKR